MDHFPTNTEYNKLIEKAIYINRENYLDIVHDAILISENINYAIKILKSLSRNYKTIKPIDATRIELVDRVCFTCNQVLPQMMFRVYKWRDNKYLSNDCKKCQYKKNSQNVKEWQREKFKTDPEFRKKNKENLKIWLDRNKEEINRKNRERYKSDPEYRKRRDGYQAKYYAKRKQEKSNLT